MVKSINNVNTAHRKIELISQGKKVNEDSFQTSTNRRTFQHIPIIKDGRKPFLFT